MQYMVGRFFGTTTPFPEILIRLLLAAACGMAVGFDREMKNRPAGLRTHMLVCVAAATFTILTFEMFHRVTAADSSVSADPLRIIEAVVAGVAFLGAGTILRSGRNIEGITTGASLWLVGAIGIACGAGYYAIAIVIVILALLIVSVLLKLEHRINSRSRGEDKPHP
ncbi:MAG: MgtC/SapB family protein [Reyranella sp.]